MTVDSKAALFLMLGQAVDKIVVDLEDTVPQEQLLISRNYDLASMVPDKVRDAVSASYAYKLFFVFENYLREFVVEVLSKGHEGGDWYKKLPEDVKGEVEKLAETEETKIWMSLGSRDKSALLTLPQLLRVIDVNWKEDFAGHVRDKALVQEARHIGHLRNTICHMSDISSEEVERIKQTMRDWFRVISP